MKAQTILKKKKIIRKKKKAFLVSEKEKERAISEALKPEVQTAQIIASEVDKIIRWINQEEDKLAKNPNHQAFLSLDFKYSDGIKRSIVDSVLRLLGSRILNEKERFDFKRPASVGIQSTHKPNLYIYYEHKRPQGESLIQEKYILLISKEMKLPSLITPEKIEEVQIGLESEKEVPREEESPEILEEVKKIKEEKKPPGIFETINKVLLGEEEE